MPNSRLRFVALPLVMAMMLAGKVVPAAWHNALILGFAAVIGTLGVWVGVEAWRGAKAPNA